MKDVVRHHAPSKTSRSSKRRLSTLGLLVATALGFCTQTAFADGTPLHAGDLIITQSSGYGYYWQHNVAHYSPTGAVLDSFNFGTNNDYYGEIGSDSDGNVFIPFFDDINNVYEINTNGTLSSFGSGYTNPAAVVVDNAGNVYVGQNPVTHLGPGSILKFDHNGNLLATFTIPNDPETGDTVDAMALAPDQCTMRYDTNGSNIHQFNVCTGTQMPDLVTALPDPSASPPLEILTDIRQLPNGDILVGSWDVVFLIDSSGNVLQQYGSHNNELWSIALDPDQKTFWALDWNSTNTYRFDISSGAVVTDLPITGDFIEIVQGNTNSPDNKELGKSCNCIGDPINSATGNDFKDDQDISLGSLSLHRYYNSQTSVAQAHVGTNWRDTFDRKIEYIPSNGATTATAVRADGRELNFTLTSGQWVADPDVADRLTEQADASGAITGWTYFDAATRYQESYDQNGNLLSIADTDGLITTLTYSTTSTPSTVAPSAGLLLTVTGPRGRALNFVYNSNSEVAAITEPDGGAVSYGYDGNGNLTSVTYPDKSSRQYVYNESSLTSSTNLPVALTGDIDETGTRFSSIGYDPQGQAIISMLSANIAETQVAYNANGTSTVTYPTGSQATLAFNQQFGSFHRTTVSAPCGVQCDQAYASTTYDPNGYLASGMDFNGNLTKTTYDKNGLLDQQVDASGTPNQRTTNLTWDTKLRVPLSRTVLDASNNSVNSSQWVYNARGQVLAHCDIDPTNSAANGYVCGTGGAVPAGVRRWTYSYCDVIDGTQCPLVGLLLSATGPRTDLTQTTTYSYYMNSSSVNCGTPGAACYQVGDVHTITDAAGHVTTVASYDADGHVTRSTDDNGVNTDLTYTARGWLATRTVGGAQTSFGYTPYGAVSSVTDPDGVVITYGYDAAHRLVKITDALGNYVQYTLDAAGNKTVERVYDASGTAHKSLSRTFNTLGQLTQVVDGLNHTVFSASASGSYDANGNLVQSSDGLGVQRQLGYDALNQLVQTVDNYNGVDPATTNTTAKFSYNSQGQLTQVTDPSNLTTTYSYDGFGDAHGLVSPDTGTTNRAFDAAGDVLTSTDANGITAIHTYDVVDRLTSTSYPDSSQNVTYTYDEPNSVTGCSSSYPVGRLTRIVESAVTTMYCYDAQGRVTEKQQIVGTITNATGYAYTAAGRLGALVYPSGTTVTYSHDGDGRIAGLSATLADGSVSTAVSSVTYEPFGPVSGYTLGNGQVVTRTYDANYRLMDLASLAFSLHVARDAMGDVIAIGNASGANPATETYSYDPLYRLTQITEANGTALESVTYDATGDRLSKAGTGLDTGAYLYNSNAHQLASTGNLARAVDADGNTTGISQASGVYGFGYSNRNRIIVAQLDGSTIANYTYDALGERIQKVVGTSSENYSYDEGQQLLSEMGATYRDYIWMGDIPVGIVDATPHADLPRPRNCMIGPSGQLFCVTESYVVADGLGTPRAVSNSSGSILWQWMYQGNVWGEAAPMGTGYIYNLRFPGQYYDAETGTNYNLFRNYEPATGRYLQSDPLGLFGGQASTYAYVKGNPLSYVDPFGLRWEYSQRTGQLSHNGVPVGPPGYSGNGAGLNNPAMQGTPDVGPIPQGTYTIGPQYNNPHTGSGTMNLDPDPGTNTLGRTLLRMHGDNRFGNNSASHGCIIENRTTRNLVANSGDHILVVTP